MGRVLLANSLVMGLPALLIAGGVLLITRGRTNAHRTFGFILMAIPIGIIVYIVAGIAAARMRGEGHFYSVPFGGFTISDNTAIGFSIVIWIGLVFLALAGLFRRRTSCPIPTIPKPEPCKRD